MSAEKYVTVADLEAADLIEADVRDRCPWVVEHAALDGRPCWLGDDLGPLLSNRDGGTGHDDRRA
jgi:hypothetical protein